MGQMSFVAPSQQFQNIIDNKTQQWQFCAG